ncbi:MAG: ABC transporter substrate-binding protein [Campylobacterota bacterium]|nr:ABC transporter substrate-binding protein [Campylobacterota bacterium]
MDQFQFAGYYMAKEKGFYRDVGLDVTLKKYNLKTDIVNDVVSLKTTYGIGRSSLLINRSEGSDIKLLKSIFQSSPLVLLSTNIDNIHDFSGKKIMSSNDAEKLVATQAMLSKAGIDKNDLIYIDHSFDIDDLIEEKTDIMTSYISNETFLLEEKGVQYSVFDPKDYGFDFYSDILFTSTHETTHHKQRTINFQNASLKGWLYAFDHIDETVALILRKYNIQGKSKEALLFEAKKLKELAFYKIEKSGFGQIGIYKKRDSCR